MAITLDRGPQNVGDLLSQLNVLRRQINDLGALESYNNGEYTGFQFNDAGGAGIGFLSSNGTITEFDLSLPDGSVAASFILNEDGLIIQATVPVFINYGPGVAFADLPAASLGITALILDSNTATWGATIAGGGANKVLALCGETNWSVVGKVN